MGRPRPLVEPAPLPEYTGAATRENFLTALLDRCAHRKGRTSGPVARRARRPGSLDEVWASLPFPLAAALTEHVEGVLPLVGTIAGRSPLLRAGRAGEALIVSGLFTPNSSLSPRVASFRGHVEGSEVVMSGAVSFAALTADAALSAVSLEGRSHVFLLPLADREAGIGRAERIELRLPPDHLSAPLSWGPGGLAASAFEAHARAFAPGACAAALRALGCLRRALTARNSASGVLSTSQLLAHEVTRTEITAGLAALAADTPTDPVAALAACTGVLDSVALLAQEFVGAGMVDESSLRTDPDWDPSWTTPSVRVHFGGRRMVEGELAHRMGLLPATG
ncbi:hypothetical protein [Streptomyces sp. NPDC026589]|uniref:hypothetical protein n=1 Tax=Streptomyces sp. NPDC026589 TaxID=3155609 RepID=UPI0033C810A2